MTNEKAINQLKDMQSRCTNGYDAEAINIAIKALEEVDSLRDTAEYYERELEEKWECGIDWEEE